MSEPWEMTDLFGGDLDNLKFKEQRPDRPARKSVSPWYQPISAVVNLTAMKSNGRHPTYDARNPALFELLRVRKAERKPEQAKLDAMHKRVLTTALVECVGSDPAGLEPPIPR
jgi:hypothetical protein